MNVRDISLDWGGVCVRLPEVVHAVSGYSKRIVFHYISYLRELSCVDAALIQLPFRQIWFHDVNHSWANFRGNMLVKGFSDMRKYLPKSLKSFNKFVQVIWHQEVPCISRHLIISSIADIHLNESPSHKSELVFPTTTALWWPSTNNHFVRKAKHVGLMCAFST